jgi:AcrR family transcriptional regulator
MNEGGSALSIRKICDLAKVNLGMFNYCFKTKDNYMRLLYTGIQDEVTAYINYESVLDKNSLERLKHALIRLKEHSQKNGKLTEALFFDGLSRFKKYRDYIRRGIIPRFDFLVDLIEEAQHDGYLKKDLPTVEIFGILIFGVLAPEIFKNSLVELEKVYEYPPEAGVDTYKMEDRMEMMLLMLKA